MLKLLNVVMLHTVKNIVICVTGLFLRPGILRTLLMVSDRKLLASLTVNNLVLKPPTSVLDVETAANVDKETVWKLSLFVKNTSNI